MTKAKLMPLRIPDPTGTGEIHEISPLALIIEDASWFQRVFWKLKYTCIIRRTSITEHKDNEGNLSGIQVHHRDEDPAHCKTDSDVAEIIKELTEIFEFPDNELPVIFPGDRVAVLDASKISEDPHFVSKIQ